MNSRDPGMGESQTRPADSHCHSRITDSRVLCHLSPVTTPISKMDRLVSYLLPARIQNKYCCSKVVYLFMSPFFIFVCFENTRNSKFSVFCFPSFFVYIPQVPPESYLHEKTKEQACTGTAAVEIKHEDRTHAWKARRTEQRNRKSKIVTNRPLATSKKGVASKTTFFCRKCIKKAKNSNSNFELVFVSRIPQIRLKKSVTEILWQNLVTEILLRRFCDRNSHTL